MDNNPRQHPSLPRMASKMLDTAIKTSPATVVLGARQTGKSTLVNQFLKRTEDAMGYVTLDEIEDLDEARRDPERLLSRWQRMAIDEVQRAPELLLGVKRAIDRNRQAGRFILTGSANILLMHKVSESLAGRAAYLTLWPLTRREQLGQARCGLWNELFETPDSAWATCLTDYESPVENWHVLAQRGGYPTPSYELQNAEARKLWFAGYTRTYLERDLQEISNIQGLADFRRLMRAVCLRLGQLMNQTELGRDVGLPQSTVHRYLNLLEISYQLIRVPAYSVNRTKRLIKTPKLYWSDTGLALFLTDEHIPQGAHLENLVLNDLVAWRDSQIDRPEILYWRTASGEEVDFVIEWRGQLLPIEIKSTLQPRLSDAKHLRTFRDEYGAASRYGLLVHTGNDIKWLAEDILAVPWWRLI